MTNPDELEAMHTAQREEFLSTPNASDAQLLADAEAFDEAYANVMPAEQYNRDLLALVKAARAAVKLHEAWAIKSDEVKDLVAALEQFEPWLDQEDENDYRGMGWVDDKGRP